MFARCGTRAPAPPCELHNDTHRRGAAAIALGRRLCCAADAHRWYRPPELLFGARHYSQYVNTTAHGVAVPTLDARPGPRSLFCFAAIMIHENVCRVVPGFIRTCFLLIAPVATCIGLDHACRSVDLWGAGCVLGELLEHA